MRGSGEAFNVPDVGSWDMISPDDRCEYDTNIHTWLSDILRKCFTIKNFGSVKTSAETAFYYIKFCDFCEPGQECETA